MADTRFYVEAEAISLASLADATGARLDQGADSDLTIQDAAPLDRAGPHSVSFIEKPRYLKQLTEVRPAACFVPETVTVPGDAGIAVLRVADAKVAFARALDLFFTARTWAPDADAGEARIRPGAHVDPSARLEAGCVIHPGAVVEAGAEIGRGTVIGPNTVIALGVTVGRNCRISAGVVIQCAMIGDRVIIHPGVSIGQDGFGFVHAGGVHHKIPQVGRVIIQDDVEIGSSSTVDRGAHGDTVIGAGTKIDNLVQIAHNCTVGRGCILVAQSGIAGHTVLGDYVVLGGNVGTAGHLTIGDGAQVAAKSGVHKDIPAGEVYGGYPAKPAMQWRREVAMLNRMTKNRDTS